MFDVVLFEPEIPPNTGNVMRLCANTGARLHLVRPLGFTLTDRHLGRAGMDYRHLAKVTVHDDWTACCAALANRRMFAMTTRARLGHDAPGFRADDVFVFGSETKGLPASVLRGFPGERCIRLPMIAESRSLNLSNAVAVVVYEAWRQNGFAGSE